MHNPDSLFYAWMAGFMDGEGCFTIGKVTLASGRYSYKAGIIISNTYRPPLDEILQTLGYGKVYQTIRQRPWKDAITYQAAGTEAITLTRHLRPYLRVKGAQADVLLQYPIRSKRKVLHGKISDEDYALREQLFQEMKALNAKTK